MAPSKGPGCSHKQACPPPVVAHSEPGTASRRRLESGTGIRMSSSPASTKVETDTPPRRPVASWAQIAASCAAWDR